MYVFIWVGAGAVFIGVLRDLLAVVAISMCETYTWALTREWALAQETTVILI